MASMAALAFERAILAVQMVLVLILVGLAATAFYNVYLHPLRKYPGPKLYAATRLKWFYETLMWRLPMSTAELHNKYGPVVRLAPNELSYISAGAWNTIYGHRTPEMGKTTDGTGVPVPHNGYDTLITANRADHARMRRAAAHAFSDRALREQEDIIQQHLSALIAGLRKNAVQGPQEMVRWFHYMAFDIIGDLSFGRSFGCLESGNMHSFVSLLLQTNRSTPIRQAARYYGFNNLLLYFASKTMLRSVVEAAKFARETVAARIDAESSRNDFMSYILRHNDEKGLSRGELDSMASLLIGAGSDTTASLLSGALYYLAKDPRIYKKLATEVRGAFKRDEDITMLTVFSLPYLSAVLNESLRIYPPASSIIPRVVPAGGDTIEGQFVPGGTAVAIPQWAANQSSLNFHRPLDFVPERWIDGPADPASPFAGDARAVFQPFSYGPRNCLGKNLANAEMRLAMCKMMLHFDFEFASADIADTWRDQLSSLTWFKKPLMMNLKPRVVT